MRILASRHGFTIVELIVVIAIGAMLTLIGAYSLSAINTRPELRTYSADVVGTLRRAQWQTMNGNEDDQFGVYLEPNAYTLFKGAVYNNLDPENVVQDLPNNFEITNISLNGGGTTVLFTSPFGETTHYGQFSLKDVYSTDEIIITINRLGMIDAN